MSGPAPKDGILDISPYVPGKAKAEGVENPIKLSANENILGSSPKALEAYVAAAPQLFAYPDPRASKLREEVARRYGLEPDRLIFGCGTDEIFHYLTETFVTPGDNTITGEFGFLQFAIRTIAAQGEIRHAPEPNLRVSVDEILKLVDERTRIVFIANPGNPTGTTISGGEIERLADALPDEVLLVIDGAYREFIDDPDFEDGLDLARDRPNIVVTRTFSKLHGLPALRVGWGYGPKDVIEAMERIRLPFNVSIPAQAAALAALQDEDFQRRSRELVWRWRPWLTQQIGGLGLEVTPSQANFILVHFPKTPGRTAEEAEAFLAKKGLLVRYVGSYGLPDCIRITIGLEEHNRALVEALAEFMK
jgi:histidinol-phosphate aminotransferase